MRKILFCIFCTLPLLISWVGLDVHGFFGTQFRGDHGSITMFAIPQANDLIYKKFGTRPYPTPDPKITNRRSNPIMQGNGETDAGPQVLRDFIHLPAGEDWDASGLTQSLHSLRDYDHGYLLSTYEICEKDKQIITNASKRALDSWKAGNMNDAFYFIGHSMHNIQDSFSRAHARRDGNEGKRLKEVCTYKRDVHGVCVHPIGALDDWAWSNVVTCNFLTIPIRNVSCLKTEAKWALRATIGYMYMMAETFYQKQDLEQNLNTYFNDRSKENGGYFNCSDVAKDTPKARSDLALPLISVDNGQSWGAWTLPAYCPENTWAQGFSIRMEKAQNSGDDTALNAVKLYCGNSNKQIQTSVLAHNGFWGDWTTPVYANDFLTGFKMRVEPFQGKGTKHDDTAANNIVFYDKNSAEYYADIRAFAPAGTWGNWGQRSSCPVNTAVCGIQVRVEDPQGALNDDTALNDVQLACCSVPH